ncbi:glycosyltransferase [Novosphingobium sp.]|uniref:glycosyltransferase n=1 Tax=Novosphingobium sp. TaxID=1874826 RepID=UPI0033400DF5
MTTLLPPVSIVVNTYNRGAWLDDALRGLAGLDYPEFEVIVVNGPSTDNSAAVIARWGDAIKALSCDVANLAVSRNVGIAAASGAVVAFIDDDAVPHPQWLRRLATRYADADIGAVGGYTIDNTGTQWQVRKTLCDRFGNAHNVTDYFDERPLNRPGTPFYPSLLGTNCSFRASALRGIGGFDHRFAYLLDETDVCLRLVDAGWQVHYEPRALVYHQFAASHIRSGDRVARTLYPSAVSKSYFIMRHGSAADAVAAGHELEQFRRQIAETNLRMEQAGDITHEHRHSLDEDLVQGIARGQELAREYGARQRGDLATVAPPPLHPFPRAPARRIALVSQGWPPHDHGGIARWTALLARGLAARGHHVHVITRAPAGHETVRFSDGIWLHRLIPDDDAADAVAECHALPPAHAAWAARVWREAQFLKSFGLEIVSFPIWDLEAVPLLNDPDLATVISLHTTYAMARPFKPEWTERPIFGAAVVDKVIAAECAALARAPHLLANSAAVVDAIEHTYGLSVADRATVVPHGTPDPLITRDVAAAAREAEMLNGAPIEVLFVGRFEPRKGFDIAVQVAAGLLDLPGMTMRLVGGVLDDAARDHVRRLGAGAILNDPRIRFAPRLLDRDALDDAYVAADVVLMPSRFESFGLVAIEAMAARRPLLALEAGASREVARPEYGARAFPDGPDVVAAILAELMALAADRPELRRRGEQARAAWAAHFTLTAMIDGVERFFTAVPLPAHLSEHLRKQGPDA